MDSGLADFWTTPFSDPFSPPTASTVFLDQSPVRFLLFAEQMLIVRWNINKVPRRVFFLVYKPVNYGSIYHNAYKNWYPEHHLEPRSCFRRHRRIGSIQCPRWCRCDRPSQGIRDRRPLACKRRRPGAGMAPAVEKSPESRVWTPPKCSFHPQFPWIFTVNIMTSW